MWTVGRAGGIAGLIAYFSFRSEPGHDLIGAASFRPNPLAEGDWVFVVPEPTTQSLNSVAILSVAMWIRRRLSVSSLRDAAD